MGFVVVATPDVVGERMAGPGIRALHFARELGKHFSTALVAQLDGTMTAAEFPIVQRGTAEARDLLRDADVVIGQPTRELLRGRRGQRTIYDLFDPVVLELRELYGAYPSMRQRVHMAAEWWRLREALLRGDLLMCATPRQRDFYRMLQWSAAPWIEVPFGAGEEPLDPPMLSSDVPLLVWGGGVWEWLDPATAVDAVLRLNDEGLPCRLLFLGRARPNQELVDRRRESRFERLLERGRAHVIANDQWVPYRERLQWLRSGKVAIMLHRSTAEAEYSIRTRLFDAIAAEVPIVATAGGFAADLVAQKRLGLVVPPGDVKAVAGAVRRLLEDDVLYSRCVENLRSIRPQFAWDVVTRPLIEAVGKWQMQSTSR
jgi:glycosyltransferase involved in cell wall biosynthesis